MNGAHGFRRSLVLALVVGVAVCASFLALFPERKRVAHRHPPRPVANHAWERHR